MAPEEQAPTGPQLSDDVSDVPSLSGSDEEQPAGGPPGAQDSGSAQDGERPNKDRNAPPRWLRLAAVIAAGAVTVVVLVLIGAAVLPTWWAQTVGRQVDGVGAAGVLWGLAYGIIFTLIPILVVMLLIRVRWNWKVRLGIGIAALVALMPNLLTLTISIAASQDTRTARTQMIIEAPNFRGATLAGVIATLVLSAAAVYLTRTLMSSRRELATIKGQPDGAGTDPGDKRRKPKPKAS